LNHYSSAREKTKAQRGFSLIEILTVVTIMVILITISSLVFTGSGQDMTRASSSLSDILQQARTRAMSNNNYVYVGLAASTGPSRQLAVAVVESIDGLSSKTDNLAPDPTTPPIRPARKLAILDGVQLDTSTANSNLPGSPLTPSSDPLIENLESSDISFPASIVTVRNDISDFSAVIQFSPDGAARLSATDRSIPSFITFGLIPATGEPANAVGVIIDGASGGIRIVRPGLNSGDNG
jgi:prepilin-type N-terminal cleavage/methylation domain-containing protein